MISLYESESLTNQILKNKLEKKIKSKKNKYFEKKLE
jgi:hypothetical protein